VESKGGTALNTNTSSDKSSQPAKVEREQPAVTRRTLLKGSAALAAAALGTHAGTSAIGASPVAEVGSKRSTFPAPAFLQGTTLRVVGTGVTLLDPIKAHWGSPCSTTSRTA
jgi:secreted PhoX family phosphatase